VLPTRPSGRTLPPRTKMDWTQNSCIGGSSATTRTNTPLPLKTGARCVRCGGFAAAAVHLRGSVRHWRPGAMRAGRYHPANLKKLISQSLKMFRGSHIGERSGRLAVILVQDLHDPGTLVCSLKFRSTLDEFDRANGTGTRESHNGRAFRRPKTQSQNQRQIIAALPRQLPPSSRSARFERVPTAEGQALSLRS
jgi:hypothetical protein